MPDTNLYPPQIPGDQTPSSGAPTPPPSPAPAPVRPVALGGKPGEYPAAAAPITAEDVEAVSAYKTLEARRARKRRNRIIAGLVIAALLIGAGFFAFRNLIPSEEPVEEGPGFDIGYVVKDTFETNVSASGSIKPESQVVVTPEVDGTITEVRVAEGDKVSRGDILFILKNDALDKAVEDAERALRSAENNVTTAQNAVNRAYNSLVNAQSNYDTVFSTSYETQEIADAAGAEAAEMLDSAQAGYDESMTSLESAQDAVTTAEEALTKAQEDTRKRTVLAPESGAVVSMNASVGAAVGEGRQSDSSPLVAIADLSTLRVLIEVNEVDINYLKEGQVAEVTFSAIPDLTLEAVVEHIAATSSNGETESFGGGGIVTYEVALLIENPDPQVKPGMTARVKIFTEKIEDALTVSTSALQMIDDQRAIVYVAPGYTGEEDPSFEERTVTVLAQDSTLAAVEGNLKDGDAVQLFYTMGEEGESTEETYE